jgi:hypothetical protein
MSGEWITWAGGECPVPPETVVMVRFRHAGATDVDEARCFHWATVGNYGDIIAYRIHEAEPAEPAGAGVAVPDPRDAVIRDLLAALCDARSEIVTMVRSRGFEGEGDVGDYTADIDAALAVAEAAGYPTPPAQDGTAS